MTLKGFEQFLYQNPEFVDARDISRPCAAPEAGLLEQPAGRLSNIPVCGSKPKRAADVGGSWWLACGWCALSERLSSGNESVGKLITVFSSINSSQLCQIS